MSSKLFAFQMAKPIGTATDENVTLEYDAHSQTLVWHGGEQAQADLHCSYAVGDGGYTTCSTYGGYCYLDDPYDDLANIASCDH
jgi:hypothetical protein